MYSDPHALLVLFFIMSSRKQAMDRELSWFVCNGYRCVVHRQGGRMWKKKRYAGVVRFSSPVGDPGCIDYRFVTTGHRDKEAARRAVQDRVKEYEEKGGGVYK